MPSLDRVGFWMERQRSQSAWVRAFFWVVFWATCWASSGKGSAARSSARTDRERSRISWPSKVVQGGSWDTRSGRSPLVPGASSSTKVSWDESSAQLDMLVGSSRGRSTRCARVGSFPCSGFLFPRIRLDESRRLLPDCSRVGSRFSARLAAAAWPRCISPAIASTIVPWP